MTYLDIGWMCGGAAHSQILQVSDYTTDRKGILVTFLGSESHFTAVEKECATPPHVHQMSRYVTACDQLYQAFLPLHQYGKRQSLGQEGLGIRLPFEHTSVL